MLVNGSFTPKPGVDAKMAFLLSVKPKMRCPDAVFSHLHAHLLCCETGFICNWRSTVEPFDLCAGRCETGVGCLSFEFLCSFQSSHSFQHVSSGFVCLNCHLWDCNWTHLWLTYKWFAPGSRYEKMISGMYMGEIARLCILDATQRGLLLQGHVSQELQKPHRFYAKYISEVEK